MADESLPGWSLWTESKLTKGKVGKPVKVGEWSRFPGR